MARPGLRTLSFVFAVGTAMLAAAGSASAATSPFGCRASATRVTLGSGSPLEPIVANSPTDPCRDASAGVSTVTVPSSGANNVTAGPAGAFTFETGSAQGVTSPGAAAVASVQGLAIPTSSGIISFAGPVQANASYECVNGQVVGSAQSTLDLVNVNGSRTMLPAPGASMTIPLGGGGYIAVNEKLTTSSSLTERVLDIHLSDSTNIVVGEAQVTQNGSKPCAGTQGVPPSLEICPPGSTLNVVAQFCEIVLPGQTIIVSRPFKGPSGGTVVPLSVARRKHNSPCLSGPGPRFALIATKRGGRVNGTPLSDRILALGIYERVTGLGGNDCIDGQGGSQRLFDGNGKDRLYASRGFNRIAMGNGNDYVNGRHGRDWITAGNGNDRIIGGAGSTRIDVGLGRDRITGGAGRNRIFAGSDHAVVSCGSGGHNTAFLRPKVVAYAARHGCQSIHKLR